MCTYVAPLDRSVAEERATVLRAMADPTRLQVLSMLRDAPEGEACGCSLNSPLHLSQPTVSYHLKVLIDAGLVCRRRSGNWMWYSICNAHDGLLMAVLAPTRT